MKPSVVPRARVLNRAVPLLLMAALTTSCVSIPTTPAPTEAFDVPSAYTTGPQSDTAEDLPSDQWWSAFGDDQLSQLIERGLERNLDLRLAATRVELAAAQARIAGADLKPQASVSLPSRRSKQNFIGFPIPGAEDRVPSSTSSSHSLTLSASWEPDLWGRLRAGRNAAQLDAAASRYDLAAARTSLAAQLAKLYFNHAEAAQQVALDSQTLRSRRETLERIDQRYTSGLASPLEVRLAAAQVAAVEASLAANQQRRETLVRQLEVLLGDYPAGELLRAPTDGPNDTQAALTRALAEPVTEPIPAGLPSDLLQRRPDLRAAEQRALAAAQRVGQARAALYPSFSLTASGGTSSNDLSDLLDSDFSVWTLASNLLQPLFQGGRLRAAVDANVAAHEQTLLQWIQLSLRAYSEVENQLVAERRTEERMQALMRNLEQTREAERLATDRYLAGLSTYLDLLESQRQAFVVEGQWLNSQRQRIEARIDLILALGGGFWEATAVDHNAPDSDPGAEDETSNVDSDR